MAKAKKDEVVEITELYGGQVRIEFRPESKRGRYKIFENGELLKPSPPSVTGITGIADFGKSNALCAWTARMCMEVLRERILPDQIHGAQFLEDAFRDAQANYRNIKQSAADTGTLTHQALERHFKEPEAPPPLHGTPVRALYDSALDWFAGRVIEPIAQETPVFSRKHKFVGTLDNLSRVDGIPSMVDFKAARSLYKPYIMQIAGYIGAYEEEHPDVKIEQAWILKLSEDGAKPYKYDRAQLDAAYQSFLYLRGVYEWERTSGKMIEEQKDWLDL